MKIVKAVLALSLMATSAFATNELDNESQVANFTALAADLPQTIVVRTKGDVTEVLQLNEAVQVEKLNKEAFANSQFAAVNTSSEKAPNELDQDLSAESWYFYYYWGTPSYYYGYNYNFYPYYNYYGYNYYYRPYYNYNWYGWNYTYYRWW